MTKINDILSGLQENRIVPYLGPGVLAGVTQIDTGAPIPADSNSLILAMNNGTPMAPKLMYEFPRAAMNMELKRGRSFVERFLEKTYGQTQWTRSAFHNWLASWKPRYVIDINRDTQLQETYADQAHILIRGLARIAATDYRFTIHVFENGQYREITQEEADPNLPILFKPMGSPSPSPRFIASDADYVDYITELMGGFAIPSFLKEYRKEKQYLLIGLPLNRDSERMVMSDITYHSAEPRGWMMSKSPTDKEKRYCEKIGLEILDIGIEDLLAASGWLTEGIAA